MKTLYVVGNSYTSWFFISTPLPTLFQWQSRKSLPSCPIPPSYLYNLYMLLNLLSNGICMKYLLLDVKQPPINQSINQSINLPNALPNAFWLLCDIKLLCKITLRENVLVYYLYQSVGWRLIDWCLTPTLAVFQLYRGVNKFFK